MYLNLHRLQNSEHFNIFWKKCLLSFVCLFFVGVFVFVVCPTPKYIAPHED